MGLLNSRPRRYNYDLEYDGLDNIELAVGIPIRDYIKKDTIVSGSHLDADDDPEAARAGQLSLVLDGVRYRENSASAESTIFPILTLPRALHKVPIKLKKLILKNNEISFLLPEIGVSMECLSELEFLDVSHNRLEFIPEQLANLKSLRYLLFNNNFLLRFPDSVGKECENLREVSLANNRLTTAPESLLKHSFIIRLNLSGNNIKKLSEISMPRVRTLILSSNAVEEAGPIKNCNKLEYIDLSRNKLRYAPRIDKHSPVEELNLSSNLPLRNLPLKLTFAIALRGLQELSLPMCSFGRFPEILLEMPWLTKINLAFNQIDAIPRGIQKIINLQSLYLKNNNIKYLPMELLSLRNLVRCTVDANPLELGDRETATIVVMLATVMRNPDIVTSLVGAGALHGADEVCPTCNRHYGAGGHSKSGSKVTTPSYTPTPTPGKGRYTPPRTPPTQGSGTTLQKSTPLPPNVGRSQAYVLPQAAPQPESGNVYLR